jgi:HEAT repeat protein
MPLIKRSRVERVSDQGSDALDLAVSDLCHPDAGRRWAAARRLGDGNGAVVEHLASALKQEKDLRVLEAVFTSLVRIGGEEAVRALLPCLRSDHAALRVGAIEALQLMPDKVIAHVDTLLKDADSDVRIMTIELLRKMPRDQATPLLCIALDHDEHPNVCAAAIDVLAEVGTLAALPYLERCRARFTNDPFLPFAISMTVESIWKGAS